MKRLAFHKAILLVLLSVLLSAPLTLHARPGGEEILAMTRTLNYVRALDSNNNHEIDVFVLYNPADANGLVEARFVQDKLSQGSALKAGKINAQVLSAADISKGGDADVYFITMGMDGYYDDIRKAAREKRIFTLSNDLDCAEKDCCALALVYEGSVQIYLNESVLNETGFDVESNFRYLAKRI